MGKSGKRDSAFKTHSEGFDCSFCELIKRVPPKPLGTKCPQQTERNQAAPCLENGLPARAASAPAASTQRAIHRCPPCPLPLRNPMSQLQLRMKSHYKFLSPCIWISFGNNVCLKEKKKKHYIVEPNRNSHGIVSNMHNSQRRNQQKGGRH